MMISPEPRTITHSDDDGQESEIASDDGRGSGSSVADTLQLKSLVTEVAVAVGAVVRAVVGDAVGAEAVSLDPHATTSTVTKVQTTRCLTQLLDCIWSHLMIPSSLDTLRLRIGLASGPRRAPREIDGVPQMVSAAQVEVDVLP